jgi:cell division protein FtsZ
VDVSAQTFFQLVVIVLALLLAIRILVAIPGWIRRGRHPETRSILVVGVGGGGGNAVDRMVDAAIPGVEFVACNTDAQALRQSLAGTRIRIGDAITHGLGSGGDPEIGRKAADDDAAKIAAAVAGADLVFVTAGLGGGTGSGAAPIVAAKAREGGARTIAIVTKPFDFEGTQRQEIAEAAAATLLSEVDALITVPNDRVADVVQEDASALEAFRIVDDVLLQAVQGIVDLLTAPGLINLDFADVRAVVQNAGPALIGLGRGSGEQRAVEAARRAISSPLLEANIEGARGILFHVSGPADLRLREVRQAADEIRASADPRANVIFGASLGEVADGEVMITLIATGLDGHRAPRQVAASTFARPPRHAVTSGSTHGHERPVPYPDPAKPSAMPEPAAMAEPAATLQPAATTEPAATLQPATVSEESLEVPAFLRKPRPPTSRRRLTEDQALTPRSAGHSS